MNTHRILPLPIVAALALAGNVSAQDANKPAEATGKAAAGTTSPDAEKLEAKFIATLTNATLKGRWSSVKDGQLGPEKEEQYNIVSVTKLGGDKWQINARVKYGGKDLEAPIPVRVSWAGGAAVLIVDNLSMGGPRTYSARVLIHENTYAGWWTAGDHGGLLNGVITQAKN